MITKRKCPEKGCDKTVECWIRAGLMHQSEYNMERACKKHKKKYERIYQEHVKACERLGITP